MNVFIVPETRPPFTTHCVLRLLLLLERHISWNYLAATFTEPNTHSVLLTVTYITQTHSLLTTQSYTLSLYTAVKWQ